MRFPARAPGVACALVHGLPRAAQQFSCHRHAARDVRSHKRRRRRWREETVKSCHTKRDEVIWAPRNQWIGLVRYQGVPVE